jgi:CRP-like cAMP-binding protein
MSTTLAKIKSFLLFTGLDDPQLEQVLHAGIQRNIHTETYLYMQGDEAQTFFLLVQGRVKLSQVTLEGHQVILRYAAPGESFGVVAALSGTDYPVSAQTVEDSQVLSWDQTAMHRLMSQYPIIALNALRIMSERVREFQDRIRELSTERVERRIARALIRLARQTGRKVDEGVLIDLALTRQDLAEMTATTLYTVSRTLSQWESKGLIKSGREQVIIRFPHGLVAIAEDLPPGKATPPLAE